MGHPAGLEKAPPLPQLPQGAEFGIPDHFQMIQPPQEIHQVLLAAVPG